MVKVFQGLDNHNYATIWVIVVMVEMDFFQGQNLEIVYTLPSFMYLEYRVLVKLLPLLLLNTHGLSIPKLID